MDDLYHTPSKLLSTTHSAYELRSKYTLKSVSDAQGYQSDVFFMTTPNEKIKTFAVKKQHIKSPRNTMDRVYREFQIIRHLSKLPHCNHFVSMVDWFKITGELDTIDADGGSDNANSISSSGTSQDPDSNNKENDPNNISNEINTSIRKNDSKEEGSQFMYFVLEYAGMILSS